MKRYIASIILLSLQPLTASADTYQEFVPACLPAMKSSMGHGAETICNCIAEQSRTQGVSEQTVKEAIANIRANPNYISPDPKFKSIGLQCFTALRQDANARAKEEHQQKTVERNQATPSDNYKWVAWQFGAQRSPGKEIKVEDREVTVVVFSQDIGCGIGKEGVREQRDGELIMREVYREVECLGATVKSSGTIYGSKTVACRYSRDGKVGGDGMGSFEVYSKKTKEKVGALMLTCEKS